MSATGCQGVGGKKKMTRLRSQGMARDHRWPGQERLAKKKKKKKDTEDVDGIGWNWGSGRLVLLASLVRASGASGCRRRVRRRSGTAADAASSRSLFCRGWRRRPRIPPPFRLDGATKVSQSTEHQARANCGRCRADWAGACVYVCGRVDGRWAGPRDPGRARPQPRRNAALPPYLVVQRNMLQGPARELWRVRLSIADATRAAHCTRRDAAAALVPGKVGGEQEKGPGLVKESADSEDCHSRRGEQHQGQQRVHLRLPHQRAQRLAQRLCSGCWASGGRALAHRSGREVRGEAARRRASRVVLSGKRS